MCETIWEWLWKDYSFTEKCVVDIKSLSDSAVLDLKKDSKTLDSEFNDVLDRIDNLGQSYPSQYSETFDMMDEISTLKSNLKTKVDGFKTELEQQIVSRDF